MCSISRRDFARLSACALAGTQVSCFGQAAGGNQRPVGYAAVGLGTISDIFMRGCAGSQAAKITGLVTGHPDTKGKRYGQMYSVPETSVYTYETFDRIRDNKEIEAVYIGLPNSMHCEYHDARGAGGQARPVREADGDLVGRVQADDRCMQERGR